MAVSLHRSLVIFLVIALIVQSNHRPNADKYQSSDIVVDIAWIKASTISEVSKIVNFCYDGRSTTTVKEISIPDAVKGLLILKLVKVFMISNLIVLSGDVSLNPGPSVGQANLIHITPGQGQGTTTNTTTFCKPSTRGISISHLNVRGIRSSLDELRILLKHQAIDVFSISETWLNNKVSDVELEIEGYHLLRKDRLHANGGGIAVYIKSKHVFRHRSDLETVDLESLWVELMIPKSKSFLLSVVYRPPQDNSFFDKFQLELDAIDQAHEYLVLGDLNCDMQRRLPETKKLRALMLQFQLSQLIKQPTRLTATSSTLLDIICTTNKEKIGESGVMHLSISDHSLVYIVRQARSIKLPPKTVSFRNYSRFDNETFIEDVRSTPFHIIETCDDVDTCWSLWKSMFTEICDNYAPLVTRRLRGNPCPWLNGIIKELMRKRDNLHKTAIDSKLPDDWQAYKLLRNRTNKQIHHAKENYFKTEIAENKSSPNSIWKSIKKLMPKKSKSPTSTMQINGEPISQPLTVADHFNEYFVSIGTVLCSIIPTSLLNGQSNGPRFSFDEIQIESVASQLRHLDPKKGAGLDNIPCRLLKSSADLIAPSLTYIYNLSLVSGTFPGDWKTAKVVPLFKAGNKDQVGNYRPISILPVVAKILEKEVHRQAYAYVIEHNLLHSSQHGFRRKRSTQTALINVVDQWLQNMDNSEVTCVVFLDLAKAFDTVKHSLVLDKLQNVGVRNVELEWFRSYLHNRKQRVIFNGTLSSESLIICGVPQGSALGPLLFLIYINTLPDAVKHSKINMFADDTAIFLNGKKSADVEHLLNSDLQSISCWLKDNGLVLNASKSECILIGTPQKLRTVDPIQLRLGNNTVKMVESSKYLGLMVDSRLSWTEHVDTLSKKVSSRIGLMNRIRNYLDFSTSQLVYNATILPLLDYCDVVWGSCNSSSKVKLQSLQNRARKVILKSEPLQPLKWLTLQERRCFHKAIMMFKCLRHVNEGIELNCTRRSEVHHHNTRNSNNLTIPKPKTEQLKRTFQYSGTQLWNSLSTDIKNCNSLQVFKSSYLKAYHL